MSESKNETMYSRHDQAYLESIFRAAPIGIGVVVDRVFLEVNDRLCQMLGYNRDDLVGQSARMVYPSDEEYEFVGKEKYRQIQEHGTGTVETRLKCKDGRVIDVLLSSTPLDPADLSKGVTFTALDITERKQAEADMTWELSVNQALAEISRALLASRPSVEEISALVHKHALHLTESRHGYVASIDPESGVLLAHTLVAMMGDCRVYQREGSVAFPRGEDGTYPKPWGHSLNTRKGFYTNQPEAHPSMGGPPEGHVPITSILSVPAIAGDQLMGQVALANSERGYKERDLRAIERLTDLYALALSQVRSAEALRESEVRYRTFVENYRGIAFRGRMNFTPVFFHGAVEEITGYREEDFLSGDPTWDQIIHPDDLSYIRESIEQIARTPGISAVREYRIRRRDDEVRWVREQIQNVCDETGRPVYVQGSISDITPLKQVEGELRHRLEMEMLISRISSGFINLEPEQIDGGIEQALEQLGKFAGVDHSYIYQLSEDAASMINTHEWSTPGVRALKESSQVLPLGSMKWGLGRLMGGEPVSLPEVSALPPQAEAEKRMMEEGGIRSLVAAPLMIGGRTIGFLGFDSVREIRSWTPDTIPLLTTVAGMVASALERQRAGRERGALEDQLRHAQKMEAIGALAGGVAHDFNNLLTGILGHVCMLREEDVGEEQRLRAADIIENAANQATELTHKLLGFARRGKFQKKPVDLHRVINDTASILERTIDKRIRVVKDLQADPAVVVGDPGQLGQVILNLAVNARDAMPEGGELVFETRSKDLEKLAGDLKEGLSPGQYVCVSVRDTGVGMDEEVRLRVFEPFFTTKKPGEGTGMGLATVYGITRSHGGSARVSSRPGKGSVFHVCLPAAGPELVGEKAVEKKAPVRGEGNILVVDDEEMVLEVANLMLKYLGYKVVLAGSGREAVTFFKEHHQEIDLVLLDMTMPVMNGQACFREMKKIKPAVRAVLATGHAVEGDVQEMIGEGVLGLVQKPFVVADLSRAIAEALAR